MTETESASPVWSAKTALPSRLNIDKPGIYEMTKEEYHADPCAVPSISRSCIVTMLTASPYHAAFEHSRLGAGTIEEDDVDPVQKEKIQKAVLIGSVADELIMPAGLKIHVSPYATFQKNEAKADRDQALAAGYTVIKQKDYKTACDMARVFRERFTLKRFPEMEEEFPSSGFQKVVIWEEAGVWCRAMLDALGRHIWDYKTTAADAAPRNWTRNQLFGLGLEIQAAFYPRGYYKATGERKHFVFAVQEQRLPHDCYPITVDPEDLGIANEKINWALRHWRLGLETGHWDGYLTRMGTAQSPPWHKTAWEETKELQKFLDKANGVTRDAQGNAVEGEALRMAG